MTSYCLLYRGTRFPLRRGETVIGRSPYCSIVLSNTRASRRHCAVRTDNDELWLEDLESSNGTWVNDARAEGPVRLKPGDVIRIGTDVLEIRAEAPQVLDGAAVRRATVEQFDAVSEPTSSDTQVNALSIELVEALISGAAESRERAMLGESIRRSIDELVAQRKDSGRALDKSELTRLLAAAEILAGWDSSDVADAWRRRLLAALGAP